jgi:competence protein ComEA
MRKDEWKEFFHFSRRETTGIIALLFLVVLIFCLPSLVNHFLPPLPEIRSLENDRIVRELHEKQQEGSYARNENTDPTNYSTPVDEQHSMATKLFVFDPNTIDDEGWLSLGLSKRTVKTIRNYLSKGGRFRKAEDINRIYGISPLLAEKLLPYVNIGATEKWEKRKYDSGSFVFKKFEKPIKEFKRLAPGPLDINAADSLEWLALDGIGPALTHRILKFREKLGGFYAINQIAEVYGLPDSTFQLLKPLLQCTPAAIKRVSLNSASIAELEQHPYIRKKLAKVLIAYREQHGPFRSISDLGKIQLIDSDLLAKLVPYISVE